MSGENTEKRIDDEWKAQAAREREELQQSAARRADERGESAGALPEASFATLVAGLHAQAVVALGLAGDHVSGQRRTDRDQAKYLIDTLAILEEKTKGNVTDKEKALLDSVLFELRTSFVRM
jgi:hypothetical protein